MDEMNKVPELENDDNDSIAESSKADLSSEVGSEGKGAQPKKPKKVLPLIIVGGIVLVAIVLAIVLLLGGESGNQIGSGLTGGTSQGGKENGNNGGNSGENGETHVHDFKVSNTINAASCFENGIEELSCSCGEKKENSTPRLSHSVENGICPICNSTWNIIDDADDLRNIKLYGNYLLVCDIDLSGESWSPIGTRDEPFYGHINGNGHTISGLKVDGLTLDIGFIGYNFGVIENLGFKDVNINVSADNCGVAAGQNYGMISNCYAEGEITFDEGTNDMAVTVGGLVGFNRGPVVNCYTNCVINATGDVTIPLYAGGLIGQNYDFAITNCYANGDVTVTLPSTGYVGGLIGENNSAAATNCYATGNIDVSSYRSTYAGGFVGFGKVGSYVNCYATGKVVGLSDSHKTSSSYTSCYSGGFAGGCTGNMINCFAIGDVKATGSNYNTYVGGFIGESNGGTITNCYCAEEQSFTIINNKKHTNAPTNSRATQTSKENLASLDWTEESLWSEDIICWSFGEGYPIINYSAIKNKTVEISTAEELFAIAQKPLIYNYVLKNDIDLEGATITSLGTTSNPLCGVFDGNGYKIFNFTLNASSNYTSLFPINVGCIKNLLLEEFYVADPSFNWNYIGSVAGMNYGKIESCSANGYVFGMGRIGGLVAENVGQIIDCNATVTIEFTFNTIRAGGIAGSNIGTIISSYAITGIKPYYESRGSEIFVGGLVGENLYGGIFASYSEIDFVKTSSQEYDRVSAGGLVGNNFGKITLSFAAGIIDVSGTRYHYVGGLVGDNCSQGEITNCYAVTAVDSQSSYRSGATCNYVGGLVGLNQGVITSCYGMGSASGSGSSSSGSSEVYVGGLVGSNEGKIENSIASGNVSCSSSGGGSTKRYVYAGGLVGRDNNYYSTSVVINSYRYEGQIITILKNNNPSDDLANDIGTALSDEEIVMAELYRDNLSWSDEIWGIEDEKIPTLLIFQIN